MMTVRSSVVLFLLAKHVALAESVGKKTWPKITMANFRATLIASDIVTGDGARSETATSVIAGNKKKLLLLQGGALPDGRKQNVIQDYKGLASYQVQPFFNETVCYKLPLSDQSISSRYKLPLSRSVTKRAQDSPAAQWMESLYELINLNQPNQDHWIKNGTKEVDGLRCTIYVNSQGKCCKQTACVDDDGHILSTIFTDNEDGRFETLSYTFTDFKMDSGDLTLPTGCVDLVGPTGPSAVNWERVGANDPELIFKANAEAAGAWVAEASPVFEGMTLAEASKRHGTRMAAPRLPPRSDLSASHDAAIPASFDARDHWKQCPTIGHIRNQGRCGSCWAFAATEAFSDRLCIGGGPKNFTASVEYIVDCDKNDVGCDGGFLDDAWEFLETTGVPAETCDVYKHCNNPEDAQCSDDPTANLTCPSKCSDGSALDYKKAKSAYMVAKPGDVAGMQKEIMSDGPIEVAFFVYSDFQTYKSGVYHRTASAEGPMGGHAVRILGWGTDKGIDYWLVANSWSAQWGTDGYFKIRRGTNECGIETIPAAGLADAGQILVV